MAIINVSPNDMTQVGRAQARDPRLNNVTYNYTADFSTANTYQFDMGTINQLGVFGVVRTMYADNGSNPAALEVSVSGTNQYFTIPAFAQGYFTVIAQDNSLITVDSVGGATDTVNISLSNWDISPNVWYSYGPTNLAAPVKVYGPMTTGLSVAAQSANTPVYIGGKDGTGIFRPILTDNTGAITIAGTVNLSGAITIADGGDVAQGSTTDAAVTNPASNATLVALSKGLLTGIGQSTDGAATGGIVGNTIQQLRGLNSTFGQQSSAAVTNPATPATLMSVIKGILTADGQVTDAAVTNPASSGSIIALLKGLLTGINSLFSWRTSATGTQTSVAGAAVDTSILASNANRKGATVYNDSTAILYLLVGTGAASNTVYTLQIAGGGYYEVPFGYTGQIRGIWASATGNARIVEFT